jgi:hypothetical protein
MEDAPWSGNGIPVHPLTDALVTGMLFDALPLNRQKEIFGKVGRLVLGHARRALRDFARWSDCVYWGAGRSVGSPDCP